jgi:hypothetical protein
MAETYYNLGNSLNNPYQSSPTNKPKTPKNISPKSFSFSGTVPVGVRHEATHAAPFAYMPTHQSNNWLPQPERKYHQTSWMPPMEQYVQGGVDRNLPPDWGRASAYLPAAGTAGHSPKNGHFVNGHLYGTEPHEVVMARYNNSIRQEAYAQNQAFHRTC